jgi:hypothetical protein
VRGRWCLLTTTEPTARVTDADRVHIRITLRKISHKGSSSPGYRKHAPPAAAGAGSKRSDQLKRFNRSHFSPTSSLLIRPFEAWSDGCCATMADPKPSHHQDLPLSHHPQPPAAHPNKSALPHSRTCHNVHAIHRLPPLSRT